MASKKKLEALESGVDAVYAETQLIQIDNINPISSQPNKLPSGSAIGTKLPVTNPILSAVINPPITPVSVKSTTTASNTNKSSVSTPPSNVNGINKSALSNVNGTTTPSTPTINGVSLLLPTTPSTPTINGVSLLLPTNSKVINGVTYNSNDQPEISSSILDTTTITSVNQSENTPTQNNITIPSLPSGDT